MGRTTRKQQLTETDNSDIAIAVVLSAVVLASSSPVDIEAEGAQLMGVAIGCKQKNYEGVSKDFEGGGAWNLLHRILTPPLTWLLSFFADGLSRWLRTMWDSVPQMSSFR